MLRNSIGRTAVIASLLFSVARSVRAADDQYASLKPLLGTWLIDRNCGGAKDKFLVIFKRLPKTVVAQFRSPKNSEMNFGRADIVATSEEDHYRTVTALPNDPVLKALNVKSIAGNLVVSNDEEEDDLPNNYITYSSRVSVISSLVTIRLRDHYRKATFLFNAESPLGKQTCRGTAAKQPAVKK